MTNSERLATQPLADGGTPVEAWTGWDRRFPPLDLEGCPALLVVAAHPDDETLGIGATAAALVALGVPVQVVSVTDGEAAYPDNPAGRAGLATTRRDELVAASAHLGLESPVFLGIPDGDVAANEDRVRSELEALLAESAPETWCAATWRGDGHPDHEATGRAAAVATRQTRTVFIEYPVWMWHWAVPDDPAVPWDHARRARLTERDIAAKTSALQCFASQLRGVDGPPLLAPELVARQLAVDEVVFVEPPRC